MGACYSVTVKVKLTNLKDAEERLQKKILQDSKTDYNIEKYAADGIGIDKFDDLMRIFLASRKKSSFMINHKNEWTYYINDFDASYGWEGVLMDMFRVLVPDLMDGSEILIYPDEDYDHLKVKGGKCITVH
jgi:hypothetical protein